VIKRFLTAFQSSREAEPKIAVSHRIVSASPTLEPASCGRLTGEKERLRIFAFAAKLERTEVLVPQPF